MLKKLISANDIYEELKHSIINLSYLPASKISENEIAKNYGVSRTPVRAAFTRLENEGFLTILPQRGSFVTALDFAKIQEFVYMRHVLESDVVCKFIEKAEQKFGKNTFSPQLSQSDLASTLGFHRVTVCKIIKKLREENVLGIFTRNKLEIFNRSKLKEYCE